MMARGKGHLDDKTVLDSLHAVTRRSTGSAKGTCCRRPAARAETVESYKARPNKLGRARMFGDGSIGLADPGQLAFCRIVEALPIASAPAGRTGASNGD